MPKKGVVRFGKCGKLSPRFIRPFEILERVGTIAYRLALPPSMSSVHEVFHVSMLWKYTPDLAHVVDWRQIEVNTDGTFEEGLVCILDSHDQVLRRKIVRLVRVGDMAALWSEGVNVGARGHDAGHISLLVRDEGMWFSRLIFK